MHWYMLLHSTHHACTHVCLRAGLALLSCARRWHRMLRAVLLTLPERPRAGVVLPARGLASLAATRLASAADEWTRLICMRCAEVLASAERRRVRERGHAGDPACPSTSTTRHTSTTHEFEGLRRVQTAEAPYGAGHERRLQSRRARLEFERELDAPSSQGRGRLIERTAEHAAAGAGPGETLALYASELVWLVVSAERAAAMEWSRVAEAVAAVNGARGAKARRAFASAAQAKAPLLRLRRWRRRRRRRWRSWRRWRRGWRC